MHRDIKHKNIFLSNKSEHPKVKIADFGLACYLEDDECFQQEIGTLGYKSPEMIMRKPSDFRSDVWSLGVILYQLISGSMPFPGSNIASVEEKILTKKLTYDGPEWSNVNENCIDLLKQMLHKNITERYDIADVLLHPWIVENFRQDWEDREEL